MTRVIIRRHAIRSFGYAQSACDAERPCTYYAGTLDLGAAFFRVTRASANAPPRMDELFA